LRSTQTLILTLRDLLRQGLPDYRPQ
jgi:hypothetical protein